MPGSRARRAPRREPGAPGSSSLHPGPPTMSVVRPRGSPPSVSVSRPGTNVGRRSGAFLPKVQRFLAGARSGVKGSFASSLQAPQGIRSRALALPLIGSLRGLKWCRRRESNPHGLVDRGILSPLRLPFRHSGAPGKSLPASEPDVAVEVRGDAAGDRAEDVPEDVVHVGRTAGQEELNRLDAHAEQRSREKIPRGSAGLSGRGRRGTSTGGKPTLRTSPGFRRSPRSRKGTRSTGSRSARPAGSSAGCRRTARDSCAPHLLPARGA